MSALRELIAQERKIEAIKLYRELTGLGLKEAKDAVDALESSMGTSPPERIGSARNAEVPVEPTSLLSGERMATISGHLFQGRTIEAIKLYREWTGAGLKEAKDQVEALETSLRAKAPARFGPATKRGGCLGSAALLTLCAVLVICWIVRN